MSDSINDTSDQMDDLAVEGCAEIHEFEESAPRARGFIGLVKDAPTTNTFVVNGLSQQLIYQINLIPRCFSKFRRSRCRVRKCSISFRATRS